jgi:mono/diheme cytochrome c family protein
MYAKAAFFLFAFFLLLLPILNADHSTVQSDTPTAEVAPEDTPEATIEPTAEATPESTLEATAVVLVGDAARGDMIFHQGIAPAPACINCHNPNVTGKNGFALGPGLKGISTNAATRVEGLTSEQYIEQSIRHPSAYIVGGFRDIMYPNFSTDYSDQNIADLVAYLMTL